MKSDYEERKQARIDRYREKADQLDTEADRRFNSANIQAVRGTMGQPILIGHHSERGHRAMLKRADNDMRKGSEAFEKAKHYRGKALAAETNGAISSDDPEAIRKLQEKLTDLEGLQTRMKAINRAHKRFLKNPDTLEKSGLTEADQVKVRTYVPAYSWEPHPYPPYALQNNSANIRRVKERIASIEATEALQDVTVEGDGFVLREDVGENRIMFEFPGKPNADIRKVLKSNGFRWSPSRTAWVRHLNNSGRFASVLVRKALEAVKS